MIYPFLSASRQMPSFLKNADMVESTSSECASWVVYQTVNMDAAESALYLLCKDSKGWRMVSDKGMRKIGDSSHVSGMDALLEVSGRDKVIGMPCLPIFGSSVEYLTIYHRGDVTHRSIYAPEASRSGCNDAGPAREVAGQVEFVSKLQELTGSPFRRPGQ